MQIRPSGLREALAQAGSARVDGYLRLFLTDKLEPRSSLYTKALAKAQPALTSLLDQEQPRVLPLIEKRRAIAVRDRTRSLLAIATAVAANYRREKQARGLLDYDDLIDKALAMLDSVSSAWVHFKLDRGVDHVLIDEAQDTSPRQWDIIERIVAEFTTGKGARDGHQAHDLRRRRREAVDLLVSGRGTSRIRRAAARSWHALQRSRIEFRESVVRLFVPVRTERA